MLEFFIRIMYYAVGLILGAALAVPSVIVFASFVARNPTLCLFLLGVVLYVTAQGIVTAGLARIYKR
jgi:hypothetical protein